MTPDDFDKIMKETIQMVFDAKSALWKRCLIEGHRYGIERVDKEPKDYCIYCGEPRPAFGWFDEEEQKDYINKILNNIGKKDRKVKERKI